MRKDRQLGLDELMIVNPSSSGTEAMYLGEDGTVYQVQGLGEEEAVEGLGQCFLGEDGSLYQVQGFDSTTVRLEGTGRRRGPRSRPIFPRGRRELV